MAEAEHGKSELCLNETIEKLNNKNKIYIITPEQFSYIEEKKLLELIPEEAIIEAEVLTFNRMADRIETKLGGRSKQKLSKAGKAILINRILLQEKNNLTFLGKSKQNLDLIESQITEFKKHGITVENLNKVMNETEDKYLKTKLKDMIKLYDEYEKKLQGKYIEENDKLTILCNQLKENQVFKDAYFYIDEFVGFTKQEYNIIEELLKMAKEVTIMITTDNLDMGTNRQQDIFYENKQTADKLLYIARSQNIKCEKTVFLKENKRLKNRELIHLEENLNSIPYKQYKDKVENIQLFLAYNPYSEVEQVANEIIKLVKEKEYRYRDIQVVTKDLQRYNSLCKVIFNSYNIPVFIDEKKELSQKNLIKYIISILDIYAQNWSLESVINYIKTGFLNIDEEEIYIFENKVRKWGIKGTKWYQGDWNFEEDNDKNKETLKRIKELRYIIINPLKELKESLAGRKTVEQITKRLYEFLVDNDISVKIEEIINKNEDKYDLIEEEKIAWEIVVDLLDEMICLLGEEKVTFEEYAELIRVGLNNSSLGIIPQTQDQVTVGDMQRSKTHKVKAVFILGINDGIFPSIYKKEGFFQDKDRQILKNKGVELAKDTLERLYEDNFSIYNVFCVAEEKLYLSYASSDSEGATLRPSIYITKLKKIFPNLKEKSDILENEYQITNINIAFENLIENIRNIEEKKEINPIWYVVYKYFSDKEEWKEKLNNALKAIGKEKEVLENISKENINRLYGNTLNTTVSRLEQYKSCPFSYYLKYGLKVYETDDFKVKTIDTGNFMHDVIDTFFKTIRERELNVKSITDEEIHKLIDEIVENKLSIGKNYIFTSTDKYKVLTRRLKRVILKSMKYIIESLKESDFEVFGSELEFKKGKDYEPIKLELENGKKVEITGKIDRIDLAKNENGEYIRIIDYKSSVKNIDLNEVIAGLQIQLLTYLDATCKIEEMMPAGVLYFSLIDPVIKADKYMTDEQIEEEIKKKFKMNGLILADVKVVKMMDKKLESGNSNIVPAYIDKEGNLSKKSNAVTKEQFEDLQKYTTKIIKEISEEILSGNISINPYYNTKTKKTPCEYCEYKPICQFKAGTYGNNYNYIGRMEKDDILDKIKNTVE